jgi:hypothetical protein
MLATALLHLVGSDPTVMEPLRSDSASVELLIRFQVRAQRTWSPAMWRKYDLRVREYTSMTHPNLLLTVTAQHKPHPNQLLPPVTFETRSLIVRCTLANGHMSTRKPLLIAS